MQMKYDKVNGNVGFIESTHEYKNIHTEEKYISVTTLIGKFHEQYDKEFWSLYKALEEYDNVLFKDIKSKLLKNKSITEKLLDDLNVDKEKIKDIQKTILDKWDKTNKEACDRGTKIHLGFEEGFYKSGKNTSLEKFGIDGKFVCIKGDNELNRTYGVYPEYLVHIKYKNVLLAGQIDVLVTNNGKVNIIDFKTNKTIDTKSYFNRSTNKSTKMLYPLNNLDDCNYMHYTMQLSTYMYMILKNNPKLKPGKMILYHINHDDVETIYEIEYLKSEVKRMLDEYSKEIIRDKNRQRVRKIKYVRREN